MARLLILSSELPPFRGGIATYAHELAAAAAGAGHDVTVAGPDYGADQAEHDSALPYRVQRFPGGPATMKGMPARIALTRRLLRDGPFDIVHAADWPFFVPVRLAPRPAGTRVVLTLHGTEIIYMGDRKRRVIIDLLRFWRPRWAQWIANSRFTRDLALSRFPLDPAAIRAVPLGVARDWIAARPDRAAARQAFGVGDRLLLVSLGRVVPRKGHLVLAEALGLLPPELAARIDWWVIGPTPDAAYADAIRRKGDALPAAVSLLGPLPADEVKRRLAAADLFCLPGYAAEDGTVEGFGLVFLEAAAYGVPALATRSGGIPDAVINGETGVLVPERDAPALERALDALLTDDAERHRLAEAAAAFARRMSWERVMADTYEFGDTSG